MLSRALDLVVRMKDTEVADSQDQLVEEAWLLVVGAVPEAGRRGMLETHMCRGGGACWRQGRRGTLHRGEAGHAGDTHVQGRRGMLETGEAGHAA